MNRIVSAWIGAAAVVFAAGPAAGQFVNTGVPWYWNPAAFPYGAGGGTAASAEAQGLAEVIRAQGEFNRATAEAQQAQQAARSQYIDNQVKWLQAFNEHRRVGEARREEQNAQNRAAQRRASVRQQIQPEPLGRNEFNAQTGALSFPRALEARRSTKDGNASRSCSPQGPRPGRPPSPTKRSSASRRRCSRN